MKTAIVWILLIFRGPGDVLPSAGIWTYPTRAECEADAQHWKRYVCVRVQVEVPR